MPVNDMKYVYIITWFLCSCALLNAIEFSCMKLTDDEMEQVLYYYDGSDYRSINLRSQRRSELYSAKLIKPDTLDFFVEGPSDQYGNPTYRTVGSARISNVSGRVLFLLFKKTEIPLSLSVISVDDSVADFPPASFKFINFTPGSVVINFNEEIFQLRSGGKAVIDLDIFEESFLPIHIVNTYGETLFKSTWYSNLNLRELIILYPNKKSIGKEIGLKMVSERVR